MLYVFFAAIYTFISRNVEKMTSNEHYTCPVNAWFFCSIQHEVIRFKKEEGCAKIDSKVTFNVVLRLILILLIKLMKMQLVFFGLFSGLFLFSNFSNFRLPVVMNSLNNNPDKEMLIKRYFKAGLQYREIILILSFSHKVHVGLRPMNRKLRKLHLKRENCPIGTREIISKVQQKIQEFGGCLGYRSITD